MNLLRFIKDRKNKKLLLKKIEDDKYLNILLRSAQSLSSVSFTNSGGDTLSVCGVSSALIEYYKILSVQRQDLKPNEQG